MASKHCKLSMVHMPTSKNLGGFRLYGNLMVLTSLLLSNSHCHLTVVEPNSETSSSKSPNTLSAWQLVCLLREKSGPKAIK
jgi:hypothetical protein